MLFNKKTSFFLEIFRTSLHINQRVMLMKRILIIAIILLFLMFFIPYIIIVRTGNVYSPPNSKKDEPYKTISVYVKAEERVSDMDMSQYLKEVVAAEMPAEFEKEALKAQAIASRTYLVNRARFADEQKNDVHKGAQICTDSTHCKAWICEDDRKKLWGEAKADEYWQKISDAVEETSGIIITYNDEPISAVFHSTSSGFTENAKDVWGGDVPYLVSVESKGEELSPRYHSELVLSAEEFKQKAEGKINGIDWNKGLFDNIERSEAGGIKTICIGGVCVKGSLLRTIYDLRSTNITITEEDGNVRMSVTGFGHGVGMSQYGANYLASQGMTCNDILKSYYTGVEIG